MLGALLSMPASTVGKILRRHGRSRRERPPVKVYPRYEREAAGVPIHIDGKRPLRLPPPFDPVVRGSAWGAGAPGDDRQRPCLPLARLERCVWATRYRAHPHPAIYPAHQWKCRAVDQDDVRGMGLPLPLPHKRTPHPSPCGLGAVVQQAQTSCFTRGQTPGESCRAGMWAAHLGARQRRPPLLENGLSGFELRFPHLHEDHHDRVVPRRAGQEVCRPFAGLIGRSREEEFSPLIPQCGLISAIRCSPLIIATPFSSPLRRR